MAVSHALRGEGFDASEDGTGRGTPLVPEVSPALKARDYKGVSSDGDGDGDGAPILPVPQGEPFAFQPRIARNGRGGPSEVAYPLTAEAGRTGKGDSAQAVAQPIPFDTTQITHPENRSNPQPGDAAGSLAKGGHAPAVAFDSKGTQVQVGEDGTAPTLRSMNNADSHQNGGGQVAVAYEQPIPIDMRQASRGATMTNNRAEGSSGGAPGTGIGEPGDPSPTISTSHTPAVAYGTTWRVRRLTPEECEALQGMPRGYTQIPQGNKPTADGPRYKQLGNSWAVNCARVIGERIQMVEDLDGRSSKILAARSME